MAGPTLRDVFVTVDSVFLDDPGSSPLGDIGFLVEAENGDLLVADRILPRIRRFSQTGAMIAEYGLPGEGPEEMLRVSGIVETERGVAVADSRLARVTLLDDSLRYVDTEYPRPRPIGRAARFNPSTPLLVTATGERSSAVTKWGPGWTPDWSVSLPRTFAIWERPYWGGVTSLEVASSSELLVMAASTYYPLYVVDERGRVIDSIASSPATFREIPVVDRGHFTGPSAMQRQREWLASFDVITGLNVIDDRLLVVTHGFMSSSATGMFERTDTRIDVYDLDTRDKLVEDVPLPRGGRVIGGGQVLHLLVSSPPDHWIIRRLRWAEDPGNR